MVILTVCYELISHMIERLTTLRTDESSLLVSLFINCYFVIKSFSFYIKINVNLTFTIKFDEITALFSNCIGLRTKLSHV